jgi:phage baseplate assembly protein W
MFEPNDSVVNEKVREAIANSISQWEPRIAIQDIEVVNEATSDISGSLNELDTGQNIPHILLIKIRFSNFDSIDVVEELELRLPAGGV